MTPSTIPPTMSVPPSIPPPQVMAPPTNILDNAIPHDGVHTDDSEDFDDEFDAIELTDEALRQLDLTPLGVDDYYSNETFLDDDSSEY
ncbi:hypothetical protein KI387_007811, partial [Taxus chinensis]